MYSSTNNVHPSSYGGSICSALSANFNNDNELNFWNTSGNTGSTRSFGFRTMNSGTTSTELLRLNNNGKATFINDIETTGNLISPTITTLNTSLSSKQDVITSGSRLNANLVGDGSVDNTKLSYLNSVSSNVQNQIDNKMNKSGGTFTGDVIFKGIGIDNYNGVVPYQYFATSIFGCITANSSGGHAETTFWNTGLIPNTEVRAFSFNRLLSSSTQIELIRINNDGKTYFINDIDTTRDVISKSYRDTTGINKIESTGITCNNLTVSNSVTLPKQNNLMCCRASCRVKCTDGTYTLENNTGFVITPSNGTYAVSYTHLTLPTICSV